MGGRGKGSGRLFELESEWEGEWVGCRRLFEAGRLSVFLPLGWVVIRGGRLFGVGRLLEIVYY